MSPPPFDPRAVCNLLLDEAQRSGIGLSNLALQKLLYFAHGLHLHKTKRALVTGYFEAWQFGPVHPTAYSAFKAAGRSDISFQAERVDVLEGTRTPIPAPDDPDVLELIRWVIGTYGRLPAAHLVEISHAKGAPWHFVVEQGQNNAALGLRITDAVIQERFGRHKVSVRSDRSEGDVREDAPFA